jgi:hypothetical protein
MTDRHIANGQAKTGDQASTLTRRENMTRTHDGARHDMTRPPDPRARPASAIDRTQRIFHELHADGRHALCSICDSQYRSA